MATDAMKRIPGNEMNFVVSHAPDAGSIARRADQQSNALTPC